MSEHGDVIETQTIILHLCNMDNKMHITQSLFPLKFSSKLGPSKMLHVNDFVRKRPCAENPSRLSSCFF